MNLFKSRTQSQEELEHLNKQLIDFGLYPNDWVLKCGQKKQIKIQHKEQKTFYFLGCTENIKGKPYWKNIQLASL